MTFKNSKYCTSTQQTKIILLSNNYQLKTRSLPRNIQLSRLSHVIIVEIFIFKSPRLHSVKLHMQPFQILRTLLIDISDKIKILFTELKYRFMFPRYLFSKTLLFCFFVKITEILNLLPINLNTCFVWL